ncbi:hypothetical protein GCM10007886_08470 [Methylobacterium gregans]|nr:hypothetical protein GCM10007886_08470 [Methylobacterium gregans]
MRTAPSEMACAAAGPAASGAATRAAASARPKPGRVCVMRSSRWVVFSGTASRRESDRRGKRRPSPGRNASRHSDNNTWLKGAHVFRDGAANRVEAPLNHGG